MAQKTIRVDETVHEHLEDKKTEYGVETFNDVLKRELGIIPDSSELDKLAAYYPSELQNAVREVVEVLRDVDDLQERVEEMEHSDNYQLVFTDPQNGMDLAKIEFRDNHSRFYYLYRNTKREWEQAAAGEYRKRDDEIRFGDTGTQTYDNISLDDVKDTVRQTGTGAVQRWRDS